MSAGYSHSGLNTFLWGVTATVFLAVVLWVAGSGIDVATGGHVLLFAKSLAPKLGVSLDSVIAATAFLIAVAIILFALLIEHRSAKRALSGNA
ncbi:MAG: hypothetical protein AAB919_01835 [Patescibacteria group bacterium]